MSLTCVLVVSASAEACNDFMAYALVLSCCCYTCCIRRKLRKMLNITVIIMLLLRWIQDFHLIEDVNRKAIRPKSVIFIQPSKVVSVDMRNFKSIELMCVSKFMHHFNLRRTWLNNHRSSIIFVFLNCSTICSILVFHIRCSEHDYDIREEVIKYG